MEENTFWTYKGLESSSSVLQGSSGNSNIMIRESIISNFGDAECGEPFDPQHVVIDFSPCDDDNEAATEKCLAFWDFVRRQPELDNIIAPLEPESETCIDHSKDHIVGQEEDSSIADPTAVSVLDHVENSGLIDRAFKTKIPQSRCSQDFLDYCDRPPTLPRTKKPLKAGTKKGKKPAVQALCQQMAEWDEEHPKSMEPPGHPPALSYAVMQRKST